MSPRDPKQPHRSASPLELFFDLVFVFALTGALVPLGYWMAAQGAVLFFMVIVVAYCVAMSRFERQEAAQAASVRAGGG